MSPSLVHIVKRFGPVGGMETYVWRLTHGLSERGANVSIICEQVMGEVSSEIEVVRVEESPEKPRWKSMLVFRERVDKLLKDRFHGQGVIVHSHERSISHHVTTFHGPPISSGGNWSWIQRFSPRVNGWKKMEEQELLSPQVQLVLPVSSLVRDALISNYPTLIEKSIELAWPGVDFAIKPEEPLITSSSSRSRVVFIGKEWGRKGLARAIKVVERIRRARPEVTLDVYGPNNHEVTKYFPNFSWVNFHGWVDEIPWERYDVLLHPAKNEPFGMVISEARANGLAVVMSDSVGANDLRFSATSVLALSASTEKWATEVNRLLSLSSYERELRWTWDDLVELHLRTIYPSVFGYM